MELFFSYSWPSCNCSFWREACGLTRQRAIRKHQTHFQSIGGLPHALSKPVPVESDHRLFMPEFYARYLPHLFSSSATYCPGAHFPALSRPFLFFLMLAQNRTGGTSFFAPHSPLFFPGYIYIPFQAIAWSEPTSVSAPFDPDRQPPIQPNVTHVGR